MFAILSDPHRRHFALTVLVAVGLVVYLTGAATRIAGFDLALLLTLIGGFPIFFEAAASLAKRRVSANLAVSLAAAAALYLAWVQRDAAMFVVAAEVILIMLIGESLEHFAIDRTRDGIAALLTLRPRTARVRHGDHEHVVPVEQVKPSDTIFVRPGDRIPVDGRVTGGGSSVDQSPITGESLPADKAQGDEVFAGTINLHGWLEIAVERLGADTTLEQIIHLVEHAEAAKAPTQRLADRYAAWFVPLVVVVAIFVWLLTGDLVRSVAVLVVACPCALVLATPTAIAAAMGSLVRRGVLIKGGVVLESLGRAGAVVFDKTGTLTSASLRIDQVVAAEGFHEDDVLRLGAAVESHSEHPVGRLLVERAKELRLETPESEAFVASPGLGAEAIVDGTNVWVGNPRFLDSLGIVASESLRERVEPLVDAGSTVVFVCQDTRVVGAVAVRDTVRAESASTVARLRSLGVKRIAMLTGDNRPVADFVAKALGIDDVSAELLPADKVECIKRIQRTTSPVVMVGDGVNDAPSLVTAEVGVAMADVGSDVAIASADVVLIGDDLSKLADAITLSRRMRRIIWLNILAFAVVFNVAAVIAASMAWISPVTAAVLHQVSSLAVVLNSLRLLVDVARWRGRLADCGRTVRRRAVPLATGAAAMIVAVYAASGLHVVPLGQVGLAQRFGRQAGQVETPGLHYRLPYPFGRHQLVAPSQTRRVEIGFRTLPGVAAGPAAHEWNVQHRRGRSEGQPKESTVLAGDENLVDVNLVVHYRLADPIASTFQVGRLTSDGANKWDTLVRAAAETSLRTELAGRLVDDVLSVERADIESQVQRRLTELLDRYDTGFVAETVCLADVHPPLEVVSAFRDVAKAFEAKEEEINKAEADQLEIEAQTLGEEFRVEQAAAAFRHDRTARAEGEANRFRTRAEAYGQSPDATRFRLRMESVEKTLAGRRKVILDSPSGGARRQVFLGPKGLWNAQPMIEEEVEMEEY